MGEPKLDADENLNYVLLTKRDIDELMFGRRSIPTRVRQFLENLLLKLLMVNSQLFEMERRELELKIQQEALMREIGMM